MKAGQKWLRKLRKAWALEPEEEEIAKLAAQQLDIVEAAQESLDKDGIVIRGQRGARLNPCVEAQRRASDLHARLVKELKLKRAPKRSVGRPAHWSYYDGDMQGRAKI